MLIERIWAATPAAIFITWSAASDTGEALAIDPLNAQACLQRAHELRLVDSPDLQYSRTCRSYRRQRCAGGRQTGASVLAHANAAAASAASPARLAGGTSSRWAAAVQPALPGYTRATRARTCACMPAGADGEAPALFSGDTLFNAGVGNCLHGGDPQLLYETFDRLPGAICPIPARVFPATNTVAQS
jgi:hydroxyacylglutathione hydrolase